VIAVLFFASGASCPFVRDLLSGGAGFDAFNAEYGVDPNSHQPVPGNELLTAFTSEWSKNLDFPPSELDADLKWDLWNSGITRLRGAVMGPCRFTNIASETCATPMTLQDLQELRNLGANLVQASHPGLFTQRPPYVVNETAQQFLDDLVGWAEQVGIYVVITMRTGPGRNESAITGFGGQPLTTVWTDQEAHDAWIEMWRYIADRYRTRPAVVGYNLLVEPHPNTLVDPQGSLTPLQYDEQYRDTLYDWNQFAREMTMAIREVDENTPIIVDSLQWANASWFPGLEPTGDPRTVYDLHTYDPDVYTSPEGAAIVGYPSVVEGVTFDRSWIEEHIRPVREFSMQHNAPILVGEFGLFRWVPNAADFIRDEIELFEQYGWTYTYWAWRTDEAGGE
jgi:hypothetical protein